MSAREEVLAAVRSALHPAASSPAPVASPPPVPSVPGPDQAPGEEVVALFAERVADYRAEVTRCGAAELAEVVSSIVADAHGVVVPPGLDLELPGATSDDDLTAAQLDGIEAVVTRASIGIAVTGTVVLDHGRGQGRRAVTLLPDLHVCIVDERQVVSDVGDALARLDPRRPQTWVSGPSATSDIELSRVEGVHGPRRLHVVLVGD